MNRNYRIYFMDFEFVALPGERPKPVCLVVMDFCTGLNFKYWRDELLGMKGSPIPGGPDDLLVAYYAPAEINCYLALGWPSPENIIDLYAEFRIETNGKQLQYGKNLLGAQRYYGLQGLEAVEKENMRDLIMGGGPWNQGEQELILDYCESDVEALRNLWSRMADKLDWPRALIRGEYMKAVAVMEHHGIPIDMKVFEKLKRSWPRVKEQLIASVDEKFGFYDNQSFRTDRLNRWLSENNYDWPRLPSG